MPLATVMRSGTTPSCSTPNQRPVRPKPVMTSSAIISTSSSSQIARTARSHPSGGMMNPPDESTGSMMTAETVSAPSLTIARSEEHTSELQSLAYLVCRLLLEKKKKKKNDLYLDGCELATSYN